MPTLAGMLTPWRHQYDGISVGHTQFLFFNAERDLTFCAVTEHRFILGAASRSFLPSNSTGPIGHLEESRRVVTTSDGCWLCHFTHRSVLTRPPPLVQPLIGPKLVMRLRSTLISKPNGGLAGGGGWLRASPAAEPPSLSCLDRSWSHKGQRGSSQPDVIRQLLLLRWVEQHLAVIVV